MKCDNCGETLIRKYMIQLILPVEKCETCKGDVEEFFVCSKKCAIEKLNKEIK